MRAKALAAAQALAATTTCEASVSEPAGGAYVQGGLDGPLRLQVRCAQAVRGTLTLKLAAEDAVRFGGDSGASLSVDLALAEGGRAEVGVVALSMEARRNTFRVAVVRDLSGAQAALAAMGATVAERIETTPASYAIQKVPTAYSADYADRSSGAPAPGEMATLRSGAVETALAANGRFTLGVSRDGDAKDLLFGHPNGSYAEGVWSSFVTIRLGTEDFRFDQLEGLRTSQPQAGVVRIEGNLPGTAVVVGLQMQSVPEIADSFRLSLDARNGDAAPRQIGFRVLLDTWAGDNDGVPFTIPGAPSDENYVYSREVKFNPAASPIWETFDPAGNGVVYLQSRLVGAGLTPPDEVAFTNWGTAYSSMWEYEVNRDLSVTGDSAVLSWWKTATVEPGATRTVATEYRSVVRSRDATFELLDPSGASGVVYLRYANGTSAKQRVEFTLRLDGPGELLHPDGSGPLSFEVEPGANLFRAVSVSLVASGSAKVRVERKVAGQTDRSESTVELPTRPRAVVIPVWNPTRPYPIRYIGASGDLNLFGLLKESASGRLLGEVRLTPRQEGSVFVYEGVISVPATYSSATDVEIVQR